MSAWAGSVAQVLGPQGAVAGAGFLVGDCVLVTCAHVVEAADSGIGDPVLVRFPHAGGAPEVVGRVLAEGWQPSDGQDIALISLDRVPDGLRPLQLAGSVGRRGNPVRSFGFPAQAGSDGHFGYGQAGDLLRPSLLQLTGANDLTEGFSGGPVWDDTVEAVIGMVTAVTRPDRLDRGTGIGYAISTMALRAAWPALTVADTCPYRGIEPFGTGDAGLFHGRDRAVRTVLDALADRPALVLLLGPSGSGKSSLIRAGVLPALAAGHLPGSKQWSIEVVRPAPPLPTGHDLLVVDQFEETLAEPGAAAALAEQITTIGRPGRTVLLVMRDDFYARLAAEAPSLLGTSRPDHLKPRIINVPATLDRDELHDIIVAPAASARACLQDGLAERIIDDVLDGRDRAATTVLPLLEVTLEQLWENQSDGLLTRQAYDGFGGLSGSITSWCDQVISGLPEPVTRSLLTMLVRPADPEHNIPAVRRRRRISDLLQGDGDCGRVLDALIAGRIVVAGCPESTPEPVAELAHDALIDRWYTLRTWAEQDTAYQRWLHRAEERRHQWAERRHPADLLRGHDLDKGHEWATQRRLPPEVAAFLRASQDRHQVRVRLTRWLTGTLAGLIVFVLVLAGATVWQWRSAVSARNAALAATNAALRAEQVWLSRQLAARSATLLSTNPDIAGLLAVQAYRTSPTSEAADSLHDVVARPLAQILTDDAGDVSAVAYSPDGMHLAGTDSDTRVRVWNLRTGESRSLTGHTDDVTTIAYNPGGTHLAAAGKDTTIRIWELGTGRSRTLSGHTRAVTAIAYSPDGTRLASASEDGTILVRDLRTGKIRTFSEHTRAVTAIAYNPDGTHLAGASEDQTIRIWDPATGEARTLTGHNGAVTAISYSPDGTHLASAGKDETILVRDLRTGRTRALSGHTRAVTAIAYSPDGTHLASASEDQTIRIWDPATGEARTLTGHNATVAALSYHPDGTHLASGGYDQTVRVWDLTTGASPTLNGHAGAVTAVAYRRGGGLTGAGEDGTVRLWDRVDSRPRILTGHRGRVTAMAYHPDGTRLASAGEDRTIRLWNTTTGRYRVLAGHASTVLAVAYSPKGTELASTGYDQAVRIQDPDTGESRIFKSGTGWVSAVAFSPDGKLLAGALADKTVRLWNVDTGESRTLTGHTGWVSAVAFSPDGEHLASAGWDTTVRVWDLATGRSRVLRGHDDIVTAVAYSPDGTHVASAGWDTNLLVWDLATGMARALTGHADAVTAIAYSPDGRDLASASKDETVRVWSGAGMTPPEMAGLICERLGRDLTPTERAEYLHPGDDGDPVCSRPR
ncbi:hypothetical protein Q0Z83_030630 [Actinoplanes sichuanensis]|uniref:Trypsin-like peptidase domain-containing protein n=1 Tax=Actinoplanes sichuanensis TaxID=512349 RepID=A0ABW4APM9_9ACTN|nr:trypsin-like peptidase domain-containing protein [Actinoplanes sichuanensis]BEL04872.1 hypothetical protein Q0Z83_030630 [Actinoplanes sichuanensis]